MITIMQERLDCFSRQRLHPGIRPGKPGGNIRRRKLNSKFFVRFHIFTPFLPPQFYHGRRRGTRGAHLTRAGRRPAETAPPGGRGEPQERSDFLSEMEKKLADSLAKAAAALPESKREFLLGYAEGVAAMTEAKEPAAPAVEDKPEEPAS